MKDLYRCLTAEEICKLQQNNCFCDDWRLLQVKEGFNPRYVKNSLFSGTVKLGVFEKSFLLEGGLKKHSGIYKAVIHNCEIGDNVLIENVHDYVANYVIGEGAFIQNINTLVVTDTTSFGNGVRVAVMDETGGREVIIYDNLSSHFAYIYALYKYRVPLINAMTDLVDRYTTSVTSNMGIVGRDVCIKNAGSIKNVRIGDACCIEGAARLNNGTINSNSVAPVYIGCQVVITDFIICSGSSVDEGTILSRCFVGQSCKLGHAYSASDSLFFSNCQGENGEACAVFAGPFTVTHHKSTLLIAGMFSFINAGSGSNQSNHMYKLGPIHQGIVERGAKTTSNSYVLWPAKIGAFSLIMGRHYNHSDTSMLPFSYLIEKDDSSYLAPAVNLRTVGTTRDSKKWPKRDNRVDTNQLDFINYSLLNPYTIGKMIRGVQILKSLQENQGYDTELYNYNGCLIANGALVKGIKLYEIAIDKYFGDTLVKQLKNKKELQSDTSFPLCDWIDLSGLIAPKAEIEKLLLQIENNAYDNIGAIASAFSTLHNSYDEYEWAWLSSMFYEYYGYTKGLHAIDYKAVLERWRDSSIELDKLICDDAKKEFSRSSMVGFGVDGTNEEKILDLEQVRGTLANNQFILEIQNQIEEYKNTYTELIELL